MLIAGLLAFQVVRTAMVRHPPFAVHVWPNHPESVLRSTMAQIGATAGRGEKVSPQLLSKVEHVAEKLPLAPEPFLTKGALAQIDGRAQLAERLYFEARRRNPRSPAARYFLAERYLQTGRVDLALREMAVLSRLTMGATALAPGVAAYARTTGAIAPLRRFFRVAPEFESSVLGQLAADPRNLELILALWTGPSPRGSAEQSAWQAAIIGQLVAAGDYRRAYAAWQRFARVQLGRPGVFNPEFRELAAPPPFNWTFGSAGGLANPAGDGQLEVVYFGRDDVTLAQQLLLLPPGRYALSMHVTGDVDEGSGVAWSVECIPEKRSIMTLPVARRSSGRLQTSFVVPQGCTAQQLQLTGSPGDVPRAIEFKVHGFTLSSAPR